MPASIRIFSPHRQQRPKLACDITPDGVVAGRQSTADEALTAFVPFPSGSILPGLKAPTLLNAPAVTAALNRALDQVASRERKLTLVVPDAAARVLLLDFDTLPSKPADALPIVRFRLRKLLPFEVEESAVSYQVMQPSGPRTVGQVRVLVSAMPLAVLAEYEATVREAGYEPGVVLPSTLAALAALATHEPALIVNRNGASVTTAITRENELLLHRTIDLPPEDALHHRELQQTVSVAIAYFEDTLSMRPECIYYAGPGGAAGFARVLESNPLIEEIIPVRDLAADVDGIPQGLVASVAGALAS